jgi:hypothetical protein
LEVDYAFVGKKCKLRKERREAGEGNWREKLRGMGLVEVTC